MKKVRYQDYDGQKRFRVSHPDQPETVDVYAPDRDAALCAAAQYWHVRWQSINFYAYAVVSRI